MERLPYIDAHGVEVTADVEATWRAVVRVARQAFDGGPRLGPAPSLLARVLGARPSRAAGTWAPDPAPGAALPGFAVDRVQPAQLLSLRGVHRFSRYRLDFEVAPAGPGRSQVWARTWAEFPGPAGAAYRALVVGSGGHRLVVRRLLRRIATLA
ncbi:MAG TPA: hypothetical protein VF743_13240 [Acidimicrobiales bacterium]